MGGVLVTLKDHDLTRRTEMEGILISPDKVTVETVEFDGSLDGFYDLLGCEMIEVVGLGMRDVVLIVDEEGLVRPRGLGRFNFMGRWYVGRGMLVRMKGGELLGLEGYPALEDVQLTTAIELVP